ncbi:MAG: glycosyltransferase family 2 protein [Chitinophagaceae bacterium]
MNTPLVSVIVTTYNSAAFVLETLESIKMQTYKNMELIVSDDASSDQTVALAENWLRENSGSFVRTEMVTVASNTGVSANCNRSIAAAKATWIKFIAGDDILLPTCVEDNMQFVADHPEAKIVFSQVLMYRDSFVPSNFVHMIPQSYPMNIMNPAHTATDQFKLLLLSDRINFTPSYFFDKEAVVSVGGYDERNRMAEDYPMWLKLTFAGIRLYFMEKQTVGYRQHDKAINNISEKVIFKPMMLKMYSFRKQTVFPYLPWDIVGAEKWITAVRIIFSTCGWNKQTTRLLFLYQFATVYLNPFQYVISFRKKILKVGNTNVFYTN